MWLFVFLRYFPERIIIIEQLLDIKLIENPGASIEPSWCDEIEDKTSTVVKVESLDSKLVMILPLYNETGDDYMMMR